MLRFLFPLLLLAGATTSAQTDAPQTVQEAVGGLLFGDTGAYSGNGWHVVMPTDDVKTAPRKALGSDDVEAVPFVVERVPRTVLAHEALQSYAASIRTPTREFVILSTIAAVELASDSSSANLSGVGIAGTNEVAEISWWSENEPFYSCRKVTVRLERNLHQSTSSFASEFRELVEQNMEWYPPNCEGPGGASSSIVIETGTMAAALMRGTSPWHELTPSGGTTTEAIVSTPPGEDTASISWQHDTDGSGPLQPVTVTASTERRAGETSSNMAKRLGRIARELMEIFPPNVPVTPSNGGSGGSSGG